MTGMRSTIPDDSWPSRRRLNLAKSGHVGEAPSEVCYGNAPTFKRFLHYMAAERIERLQGR
jgi:hypothetical protein